MTGGIPARWLVLVLGALALLPAILPSFWLLNVAGRSLAYGIVALSLTFLSTYGGLVSLAQTMLAGVAGYVLAIVSPTAIPLGQFTMPYGLAIPLALAAATLAGAAVGAVAVRTRDVTFLMLTLALAVGFSLLARSNVEIFNGYEGIRNVLGPEVLGRPLRTPVVFYYVALVSASALYGLVVYVARTPFGLVLQATRDNPRRAAALGFHVPSHRIASFALAGFVAGWGGVLVTFYNIGLAPGSVGLDATINVLIMSVIGGLSNPVGSFLGALIFTVLDTFAATIYDRDRFNTLIGATFLVIVLLSPDGALGLLGRLNRARHVLHGRRKVMPPSPSA